MQARGVVSSAGKTITRTGWRSILTNERYTGQCVLFRPVPGTARKAAGSRPGACGPPLVSEPVYTRVQAILTAPGRVEGRGRPARWMLAGIATCAVCDQHKAADVFDPLAGIPLGAEAGVVARVWADLPVPRKKNIIRRLFTVKVHPVRGTMNPATAHPLLGVEVDDATAVGVAS